MSTAAAILSVLVLILFVVVGVLLAKYQNTTDTIKDLQAINLELDRKMKSERLINDRIGREAELLERSKKNAQTRDLKALLQRLKDLNEKSDT